DRDLDRIDLNLVELFIEEKQQEGRAPKSIQNYLGLLHSIFRQAQRRGWCSHNPVALADKPTTPSRTEIRYLTITELNSILVALPETPVGLTDRAVVLTSAMTGLRRGEVIALRWQDIDWDVHVIRVRRNYTRGDFGTPKTRRSSRAVPLAPRLETELK